MPELEDLESAEIVAELAHTLRSRLTSILFLAESLFGATSREDAPRRRQLGLLYASALGASTFTSNLMELMRGRSGDLVGTETEPISISELLGRIRDEVTPLAEVRGVMLRVARLKEPCRLGHPMALHRMLLALIMVGMEFTDEGVFEITASGRAPPLVEFSLHAPRAIVPADVAPRLGEPVERRAGGSGWMWSTVGVAVMTARQLCEKMDGGLRIQSDRERGLWMKVVLPLPLA